MLCWCLFRFAAVGELHWGFVLPTGFIEAQVVIPRYDTQYESSLSPPLFAVPGGCIDSTFA